MNNPVEDKLRQHLLEASAEYKSRYGINPSRSLQLLERYGPVETCRRLVNDSTMHEGFTKLWELNRLDMSVEAIILREPYRTLFSEDVLERARKRLEDLEYSGL